MLDIKLIRKQPHEIEKKLQTKDPKISLQRLLELDYKIRQQKTHTEQLKAQRNHLSQKIGEAKRRDEDETALFKQASLLSDQIQNLDHTLKEDEEEFLLLLSSLPNLPMDDIPISPHPSDNVVLKVYGGKPSFSFPFKNHLELNEKLMLFDFKRGAKLSGTGFPAYRGRGARLEWALLNYMLDIHLKNGFEQWILPLLVRREVLFSSGQLPKFENQQFKIRDEDYSLFLIPTAEVPLNGLHIEETLLEEALPLRYVAYTPCFRREAGAAGAGERGLIRTHQFNKVEMFAFTTPDQSRALFDEMVQAANLILEGLELHHRNMLLVTGDISFAAARTVDIEVWLPGQNRYYEVSSISNCTDYQARRSHIKYKTASGATDWVHTLNGSGLATSRLMVALLENHQQPDGSVIIPQALRPYLNGLEAILR